MFRLACSLLTTTAVLTHGLLGCGICHAGCEHSEHALNNVSDVDHLDDHSSCHHQQLTFDEEDRHQGKTTEHRHQHPDKRCASAGCSYVGMNNIKLPVPHASGEMLPYDILAMTMPAHLESIARAALGYCSGYPPTLRAQIWLSTWLV